MPVIGKNTWSYTDYDSETGVMAIHCAVRTAANWAAQETLEGNLQIALAAITEGTQVKTEVGNVATPVDPSPPAVKTAQREKKWLVQFHDTVNGKRYTIEVPTADEDALDPNDRKHAHIGDAGVVDAFVAAFEAYALSQDLNAIAVDEITLVFRNI